MVNRARNGDEPAKRPATRRPASARTPSGPGPTPQPQFDGLEIEHDPRFQQITWRVQRVSWFGMLLVLVAALLGLFGSGPLSRTFAVDPGAPLWLEYERFGRQQRANVLRLHLGPDSTRGTQARVWLDRAYIESVEVSEISPPPLRSEAGVGRVHYTFAVTEPGRPTAITIEVKPQTIGNLQGQAGLDQGPPIRFRQWIYP